MRTCHTPFPRPVFLRISESHAIRPRISDTVYFTYDVRYWQHVHFVISYWFCYRRLSWCVSLTHQILRHSSFTVDPATRAKRGTTQRPQSFASEHARYAKEAIEADLECGERLFENSQGVLNLLPCVVHSDRDVTARVLLTWWYYSQARWIDVS